MELNGNTLILYVVYVSTQSLTHTPPPLCQEQNLQEDFCHCYQLQRRLLVLVRVRTQASPSRQHVWTAQLLRQKSMFLSRTELDLRQFFVRKKRDQIDQVSINVSHCTPVGQWRIVCNYKKIFSRLLTDYYPAVSVRRVPWHSKTKFIKRFL